MADNLAPDRRRWTIEEWRAENSRLFGDGQGNWRKWRFECPICGHVQTPGDFEALGVDMNLAYQECIGRHMKASATEFATVPGPNGVKSPCNYAAYGLFRFGHVVIAADGAAIPVFPFVTFRD